MTTDPTGAVFLSYRRTPTRIQEANFLTKAMHDHGIPTWQDVDDLNSGPAETQIREALRDPGTAGGLLWLSPEVHEPGVMRDVEVPLLVRRREEPDPFFVLPILAGRLDHQDVTRVAATIGVHDLPHWSLDRAVGDPINPAEAARIARWVLRQRMTAVHKYLPSGQPLKLRLDTRNRPTRREAITLDWLDRLDAPRGFNATPDVWDHVLIPALNQVVEQIAARVPRSIIAEGSLTLPAAVALGMAFPETRPIPLTWMQFDRPTRRHVPWSLSAHPEESGFKVRIGDGAAGGTDLAVLVEVADEVEYAFSRFADATGLRKRFRGVLTARRPTPGPHDLTPGQAVHVALRVQRALREARQRYRGRVQQVHLFMAVPSGLAVLIGQLLTTFPAVQTYVYLHSDIERPYHPAALLRPPR